MTELSKYHGLGNDFLVAMAADNAGLYPDRDLAVRLCDRRRGIGADGLIFGLDPDDPANDAQMVLLNSDGSAAEISGNGIRCLGQAMLRARYPEGTQPEVGHALRIETAGGLRTLVVTGGDIHTDLWQDVDMGKVGAGPQATPASLAYPAARMATVDVGNPHLVLLVDDPAAVELEVDGPALESGYPEGINVSFIAASGPHSLDLAVWERGAGVTEACGSGATGAAAAALDWGIV
ncbi:MAG: diaminopimelate epimerase, partial [Microthrixaceae bacterium]